MLFKTHLILGLLISVITVNYLQPDSWIIFSLILVIGSLLPDIDIAKSKVGKTFWPLSSILNILFGHRGIVHTIWPPLIVLVIAFGLGYGSFGLAFFIGYSVHLVADMTTKQGIAPLQPLSKVRASGFLKTGGILEYAIFFAAGIYIVKLLIGI